MKRVTHVAVDAQNLARDNRGIGRYARAILIRALREPTFRWTFVVRGLLPRAAPISRALGGAQVSVRRSVPADVDVLWFPWNGVFFTADVPTVATIHDATPFAFPAGDPHRRTTEQLPFLRSASIAQRILVPSRYTAGEVQRWLGVGQERIVLTPLAVDAIFSSGPGGELPKALHGRKYILHVGTHEMRKNSATLVAAFERAFPNGEVSLAFTRQPPVLPKHAVVVENPDDPTLVALYRNAAFVAVPSVSEGFGFPLLEALACGTPVLASRAGALPEVGGELASWVDDPLDVEAWSDALRRMAEDDAGRQRIATLGPLHSATFSWDRCVAQTLAVLAEVASAAQAAPQQLSV